LERSKRWLSEESERLVKEMLSSGKTQKRWRMERGVNYGTFRGWLRKFKNEGQEGGSAWIKALKKGNPPSPASPGVEVHIGGYA
jgi:transposase-like protein